MVEAQVDLLLPTYHPVAHSTVFASWVHAGEDAEGEFRDSWGVVRVAYVGS